jgi:peroxiredoxin
MEENEFLSLPPNLPVPEDDGKANHLTGKAMPSVCLAATDGSMVDLGSLPAKCSLLFCYPRMGRPGEPLLTPDWDRIPGARGCTPEACGFRDHHPAFHAEVAAVFGISTQPRAEQCEAAARLRLPYQLLSDEDLGLAMALRLPTMRIEGVVFLKRLTMAVEDGVVRRVWYPVFPPDRHAEEVLAWLHSRKTKASDSSASRLSGKEKP